MVGKKFAVTLLSLGLVSALALPALAQDSTPEVTEDTGMMAPPPNAVAAGLNSPRGIAYDDEGNLYIAEGGAGGSEVLMSSEEGDVMAGFTSQITKVAADGTQSVVLPLLFSVGSNGENIGATAVLPAGDSLWVVFGGGGPGPQPYYGGYVAEINVATGRIVNYIDMAGYEIANNPDGNAIDSNPNDLALSPDGTLYIVDTGANTLFTWDADAGLTVAHIWPDNPVPTSIAFADDGSFYIGFLSAGLAPGAGKIEHWSADGSELLETFGGLTTVTDVAIGQDGNVYAVELLTAFGEQGPDVMSGNVVMVNADGATPVAEGVMLPYSLAQAPDGTWAVSTGTVFVPPGTGAVVTIGE